MAQESDTTSATAEDVLEHPRHGNVADSTVDSRDLPQPASAAEQDPITAPVEESILTTVQQEGKAALTAAEAQAKDAAATAQQDTQQPASSALGQLMQEQAGVPLQEGDHNAEAPLQGQAEGARAVFDTVAADPAIYVESTADAAEGPAPETAAAGNAAEPAGLQHASSSSTLKPAAAEKEAQPAGSADLQPSRQDATQSEPAAAAAVPAAPDQLEGSCDMTAAEVAPRDEPDDAHTTAADVEFAVAVSPSAGDAGTGMQNPAEPPQQEAAAPAADSAALAAAAAAVPSGADVDDSHVRKPKKAYFVDGVRAIDVEVDCGPGVPCKLLHVIMDVSALEGPNKPYLGGFKHKQQGTIYHHASIQTPHDQSQSKKGNRQQQQGAASAQEAGEVGPCAQKLARQTQTVKETSSSSQTVREAATQMARTDFLLDCSRDRMLTPRPYVTAAVVEQRREAAALTIQRFSRGWFARKRAGVMRDIKAERDAFLAETAAESAQAAYNHKRSEVERRTHPLSKADFVLLESELETWRQQQTAAIKNAGLVQQEEQAALQLLLAKETRLLHTLDKLRVAAHQEKRSTGRQKVLGALAQPKTWSLSNGKKVLVHTPLTVRAAELQQLYRGLTLPSLSLDERLDVLLHVKWVSKEWGTSVTYELVELIDREADLVNRGRSPKTLDGLRKRIAGLFLTCCQNPAFNPEAARLRVNAVGPNGPEAFEYVLEQQAVE